jgi:phosphatidylserine/phosphatidylglycerophosphate/cardiolipin synthase-like enzyme
VRFRGGLSGKCLPAFLFLFFLSTCAAHPKEPVSYDSLQVYFSPQGGCQQAIIEEIGKARKTLDVAMFSFTNRELGNAVIAAQKRGVEVRVVLDESQAANRYSKKNYFLNSGLYIRLARGLGRGIMHHKFAVIDSRIVITGSFNWTANAEENNFENLLVIHSPLLAMKYADEFQKIFRAAKEAVLEQKKR